MKKFAIRCTEPGHRTCYVQHIARDGGFVITYDRAKARVMRLDVVRANIDVLRQGKTAMAFDVCEVEI